MLPRWPKSDFFPVSRLAHLVAFPLLVGILQNYFQPGVTTEPKRERIDTIDHPA